ncbi:DUF6370 family protein [Sediminibacterium ginsengisoli]|uniref:Glutaminyl-tRNA synthetase n=1 Tax=Sediminibacterium ginsengisoli TaxID=413434 RepID=A0A1T4P7A1_9BACT|nr:DUF6370 family protein [Sediminibacterium ginsengisoli]SJZ87339.1 hypothetical protein SAMN04488132_105191 [Sediminibacterium ginsengisoli]
MKHLIAILSLVLISVCGSAQDKKANFSKIDPAKKVRIAEVSCGECQFKMKGEGCHLAVRVNGKSYWVDGADVDSFGDAHDKETGFCNKIRKAEIQGTVKNNRFELTYLKFTDKKN